ncbi:hypothetical protein J4399_02475 [Candidatus Woesearchaeota archaeon]|nr:hypothetical protein [Candidatus Woesearchaeota archaeon]HIH55126.1 hypothetical protein [Candidatus Woesearchaeota archaeon]HIJ13341.1 hypothetical protein [Candidatus Woesearchaeota archaeon]
MRKNRPSKSRKSQMEAFGLALIVIIIIVGFFLFLMFRIKNPIQDYKKQYIAEQMASNYVISVTGIDVRECSAKSYTIRDLLIACARRDNVQCSGIDACELVNQTLYEITNKSLIAQEFKFRLFTQGLNWPSAGEEINIEHRGCDENDPKDQSGYAILPLHPVPRQIKLILDICK